MLVPPVVIELLIIIAMIGVLSTLVIAVVGNARTKSKITKARNDLTQLRTAVQFLSHDTGEWPNHQQLDAVCSSGNELCGSDSDGDSCTSGSISDGVGGLTQDDTGTAYSNWSGPYMVNIPLDPWGYEYFFDCDYKVNANKEPCNSGPSCSNAVVIGSFGPDGEGVNECNSDDIIVIIYP